MRKRVQIALAVLLVAIVGGIAWQVLREREPEPVYQGKGLRAWLWEYNDNPVAVTNAVRQMGTNAIPTLLEMLRKTDSRSMSKRINVWNWLHRHIAPFSLFPAWITFPNWYRNQAPIQHMNAAMAFSILGADAQQAVPDLIKLYDQIPVYDQPFVCESLCAMGPAARAAIPLLLREATSTNEWFNVRQNAVKTLAKIHAEPSVVVPALARCLSDSDGLVRHNAAEGLGDFALDARDAVPALVASLSDPEGLPPRCYECAQEN